MKRPLLAMAAVVVMSVGIWHQFINKQDDSVESVETTETTETTQPADTGGSKADSDPEGVDGSGGLAFGEVDSTGKPSAATVPPTTVPPATTLPPDSVAPVVGCVEAGFGVEYKPWGKINLPYADGWPTNQPGDPIDCAPETAFGAAIAASHALYIDAIRPELIPIIAADTPAQRVRIKQHPGARSPDEIEQPCEPLGWNKQQTDWLIYHVCGQEQMRVTQVSMDFRGGKWLLVYPITGRINSKPAEPGTRYQAFGGGD